MKKTNQLTSMALIAALCFIAFNYFKIDVHVMGGRTSFHFANSFVVLGALLLGGLPGGLAGAVGLTLADLTTGYAHVAPRTFFLKLMIGLIVGLIAHRFGKINSLHKTSDILKWSILAGTGGMIFNVIVDPLVGYIFNRFILGVDANPATIIATWSAGVTAVNGVITVVMATLAYMALRKIKFKV